MVALLPLLSPHHGNREIRTNEGGAYADQRLIVVEPSGVAGRGEGPGDDGPNQQRRGGEDRKRDEKDSVIALHRRTVS
jgi:hypothetical protein